MTFEKKTSDFREALGEYQRNHKAESGEFWRGFDAAVKFARDYEIKRNQKRPQRRKKRLKLAIEMAEQAQQWVKDEK